MVEYPVNAVYRMQNGDEWYLHGFNDKERENLEWLLKEYKEARTWIEFQQRTAHGIIEFAKKEYKQHWQDHPLYKIRLDLVANACAREGSFKGEISDMVVKE